MKKHRAFADPLSDFILLLNIWNRYHETKDNVKSNSQMKRFCKENFLSYRRMREWRDIHSQLSDILSEADVEESHNIPEEKEKIEIKNGFHPLYTAIHKAILSGFLSNIAQKKENNIYKAPKGREVMIFPGSALFGKGPTWIVAAEMVQTSRVYARTVGAIDDKWLEKIGKSLCKYTWQNPRWDKRRGEVIATGTGESFRTCHRFRQERILRPYQPGRSHGNFYPGSIDGRGSGYALCLYEA